MCRYFFNSALPASETVPCREVLPACVLDIRKEILGTLRAGEHFFEDSAEFFAEDLSDIACLLHMRSVTISEILNVLNRVFDVRADVDYLGLMDPACMKITEQMCRDLSILLDEIFDDSEISSAFKNLMEKFGVNS